MKNHPVARWVLVVAGILLAVPASAGMTARPIPIDVYTSEPVEPVAIHVDLRDLPVAEPWQPGDPIKEVPKRQRPHPGLTEGWSPLYPTEPQLDPLLEIQASVPSNRGGGFATPILNFDGQGFAGGNPSDVNGDVGVDYYIQAINASTIVIYNKSDGSVAAGPTDLATLGTPPGACTGGFGDPIILYDQLAGRWLLSEFAGGNTICVWISMTSDPIAGGWHAYGFSMPTFPDYFKIGVWPQAYMVGANEAASTIIAFDRAAMLTGAAATFQRVVAGDLGGFGFQMIQPADSDGPTGPSASEPGIFMRHRDTEAHGPGGFPAEDRLEIFEFEPDFVTPANTTLTQIPDVVIAEIDSELCGFFAFACADQPSGPQLDPLREVVMHRLVYRNFGSHETLVGNLVTDVNGTDLHGIRWFELRRSGAEGGAWTLHQEGTYSPDGTERWMGGIAMDGDQNIALGYSVSSSSIFPGLRYAGRLSTDPLGTLPQGEHSMIEGGASNGSNRWGDYHQMSIDPVDDCTFWYTGNYNAAGNSQWDTRIASMRFDSCGGSFIFSDGFESGDVTGWSTSM